MCVYVVGLCYALLNIFTTVDDGAMADSGEKDGFCSKCAYEYLERKANDTATIPISRIVRNIVYFYYL